MIKVYLVMSSCIDSDDGVVGIFTSILKAEKALKDTRAYYEKEEDDDYGMKDSLYIIIRDTNTLYKI